MEIDESESKQIKNNNNLDSNSEATGTSVQTDNISILTEETDISINTDDITVTTGFTTGVSSPGGTEKLVLPKDLSPEEKVKLKREWKEATIVQKKLASIDATHEDIKKWKEANPEQASTVAELTSSKFKEMCGIIKIMVSQKKNKEKKPQQSVTRATKRSSAGPLEAMKRRWLSVASQDLECDGRPPNPVCAGKK